MLRHRGQHARAAIVRLGRAGVNQRRQAIIPTSGLSERGVPLTADSLDSAAIRDYAVMLARSLLLSKEGKAAGYWTKPLIGKPRVTGSAYVIGTYTSFILGCPLADLRRQSTEEPPPLLPEAESLVAYFLEYPTIKATMDAHFRSVDEHAAKTLSPEMRKVVGSMGDLRETISRSGIGRAD